jgi:hypothetical protein
MQETVKERKLKSKKKTINQQEQTGPEKAGTVICC